VLTYAAACRSLSGCVASTSACSIGRRRLHQTAARLLSRQRCRAATHVQHRQDTCWHRGQGPHLVPGDEHEGAHAAPVVPHIRPCIIIVLRVRVEVCGQTGTRTAQSRCTGNHPEHRVVLVWESLVIWWWAGARGGTAAGGDILQSQQPQAALPPSGLQPGAHGVRVHRKRVYRRPPRGAELPATRS
jgi:hypothetical protein